MNQLPILVPAANLTKSPSNVRKASDPVADAQLEANIAAKGIRQNLIGLPVSRKKGHYRIAAGGRRLDAVHRLIEKGIFAADYQVPVLVLREAKDAIATSLEENFFKLSMSPADTCQAFQDIVQTEGKTPAEIAKRFGLTERFVLGRLRLADLAPCVFDALRDGEISIEVAMAYGSSPDPARQANVFEELGQGYYRANVSEIRRQLAQGSYRGSDPKALLVGREAYLAAGGRIDSDLFTDNATEMWIDGDLLSQIASDKLAQAAEAIQEREGFGEIRVVPTTHIAYSATWGLKPVDGEQPPLTQEQEQRLADIETELEGFENPADTDESEEEAEARYDRLNAEYEAIQQRAPILTEEQKASALAYVVIGQDGQPRIHEQLYIAPSAEPVDEEEEPSGEDAEEEAASDEEVSAKPRISQRLAEELAEMKAELLRIHVASDPRFALDLATFYMADAATRKYRTSDLATELRANAPFSRLTDYKSGTSAAEEWMKCDASLDRSWTEPTDERERYDAFCALAEEARAAWFGWLIARTMQAVPAGQSGSHFIDHLGQKLEIDVASWWRPTANNYFDRISKASILSEFEGIGGIELSSRYSASKKHDLALSAEKLFSGALIIEADLKEKALAWLPDAMRFSPPVEPDEDDIEPGASGEDIAADAQVLPPAENDDIAQAA
ncbi:MULTISPECIES: ParB/RepB/Spo0J family partition protein [Sphingobium]|uniref:ParB/RepB/Spo0J family partition protein n=1 Tax=Sphingobium TaxID=165695 RepID=UPI00077055FA|nr:MULTISPECIES: ParB/RepB/Spo0J family partition protein [unclassified Sphingobium]AMK25796.1 ParB family chromosome partitioning protein [Sphingobium sp. TKS]MEC6701410.1 ParB/RepB/Spo0J family partition protein [Sphingobium sp. SJ10-10]NML87736.1 ParB/RepB/Spo0J family partition protein [Sphingobium sp. TB-6]PNQ04520.1 chromosome partitioning protein ParB [Sphingobium sp. SA916]